MHDVARAPSASRAPSTKDSPRAAPLNPGWTHFAQQPPIQRACSGGCGSSPRGVSVGAADSPYEREADQVAAQILRKAEPGAPPSITPLRAAPLQRECSACKDEEVQRSADGADAPGAASLPALGSGRPLDSDTRSFMEPRFQHDFSAVRVHTGAAAEQSARDLHAHAYTTGHDIVFGAGRYQPETDGGRQLLAHELTHVVQQSSGVGPIQRYSWQEFKDDSGITTATKAAGEALDAAKSTGGAVLDKVVETGDALYEGGKAVVETVTDTVSDAFDWMTSKAGILAQRWAEFLGGSITFSNNGIVITLPRVCPFPANIHDIDLPEMSEKVMAPVFALPLGMMLIDGKIGVSGALKPSLQIQLGPYCLEGAAIFINPFNGVIGMSGEITSAAAVSLTAEVRGGLRGELGLSVLLGEFPIPLTSVGAEGGFAGIVRGIGAGQLTLKGGIVYKNGALTIGGSGQLDVGLASDLYVGAYAQLERDDKNLCRLYWEPYHWTGAIAGSATIHAGLVFGSGVYQEGKPFNVSLDDMTFEVPDIDTDKLLDDVGAEVFKPTR